MEITGTVKLIKPTQSISASFKKRELVVTTEEQYPQHILIEFVQDKTDLLDQVSEGQQVTVGINIRGREWTNPQGEVKYFNSIQGWRIQGAGSAQQAPAPAASGNFGGNDEGDDLPF